MRKHNNSKPYICAQCGFKTSYCNSLNAHKRNKHTDPALKCKVCKYVAFGEVDLKNHTCKESLCCGECGYKTHTRPNFIRHKEVHNTLLYSCSLCGTRKEAGVEDSVVDLLVTDEVEFGVSFVSTLPTTEALIAGVVAQRNKHTDPALKCKVCKYVAYGEVDLKSHTCKESLCCGVCGYKTHTRPNFIRHKEVHNTVPYFCSLCGTRSKSKTYFTAHMKNKHQVLNIKIEEYITPVTTYLDQ
ncbi:ZNF781 [Cordylochernes scorpioides]|uniref:ZNF781 n=1 Tax=Cordylochernes scorpioides TaxID=51811 RepID=A0ABY6KAH9_9ARAC|nr:ZNF781 [Cordylochernes scorpioides]